LTSIKAGTTKHIAGFKNAFQARIYLHGNNLAHQKTFFRPIKKDIRKRLTPNSSTKGHAQ